MMLGLCLINIYNNFSHNKKKILGGIILFFNKNKKTYLSIYQVESMTIDGKVLDTYNPKKGNFGDIVIDLDTGTHELNGKFVMTRGKQNQLSAEMSITIEIKDGKNILSVSDKEKHFKACTPIATKFNNNGEEIQFFVGILK